MQSITWKDTLYLSVRSEAYAREIQVALLFLTLVEGQKSRIQVV